MGTPLFPGSFSGRSIVAEGTGRKLLAGLALLVIALQLLIWSRMSSEASRFGSLCVVAIVAMIWRRKDQVRFESGIFATLCGCLLVFGFLVRSSGQAGSLFATLSPLVWGTGLALIAAGTGAFRLFWREAIVIAAMSLTPIVETVTLDLLGTDLTPVTAHMAAYVLRIAGWSASARDFIITLPASSVVVAQGCSGLKTMYFLGGFAVIILLLYPVPGAVRKAAVIAGALVIGFLVNAVRVTLLALVATEPRAFRFWHIQQGAMVFELLAVGLFLAFFYFLFPDRPAAPPVPRFPVK